MRKRQIIQNTWALLWHFCKSPISVLKKVTHTKPQEWAPQGKGKSPDKEVIHSQPVEVAMDTAGGRHAQLEEKSIWASKKKAWVHWRSSVKGWDYDLRCFRLSAHMQCSRGQGAWRACCSRCWLLRWWKLWEWPCHRTSLEAVEWSHNMARDKNT